MNLKPLEDLKNASTPPPAPSNDNGWSSQQFLMDVRVVINGRASRAVAQGHDIYGVTAPLVTNACLSLLASPSTASGVKAAGEVLEPRSFLANLARYVVAFQIAGALLSTRRPRCGGHDNAPGLSPEHHADYFSAYVLDPDGHNIEAVCHEPE